VIGRNLDLLARQYEALGFTLTPVSLPRVPLAPGAAPQELGVGNRCAIFKRNYLELLGVVDPARWASIPVEQRGPFDIDRPLGRFEGLHVLHLDTGDIETTREYLERAGLQPSSVRPFSRTVETEHGSAEMKAKSLSFPPALTPEALVQFAQHLTPELVFEPRFQRHANGAVALTGVTICAENVADVAKRYARLTCGRIEASDGRATVFFGDSKIVIVTPRIVARSFVGKPLPEGDFLAQMTVAAELDLTRRHLGRTGIPFREETIGLTVDSDFAGGALLLFEGSNDA
jgi:hypothetical protein